jgi:acyl carrier protein
VGGINKLPIEASERLRNLLADILSVPAEEIRLDSSAETISAWDSFAHLQAILAIEAEYGVRFDPMRIPELASVSALQRELEAKGVALHE